MAIIPITNSIILVNSIDLTDHVSKVDTKDMRSKVDITTMGATSTVYTKGLGDAAVVIDFFNDWAVGKVHATLQPLIASTTPFTVEVRPVNAARSTTNPAFLMTCLLFEYDFMSVKVGDAPSMSVEFTNASSAGVTYPTS